MKSNYDTLGKYIQTVDVRNIEGKEENLLGVSTQKYFIQSIANTVGTDFTKYKVVRRNQFTYVPDTSRRGDRIAVALQQTCDEGLVSAIYTVFEVTDQSKLLPEYLMLWFKRAEFDRYARFKSHGSVREIFDWDEMCKLELPVPHISVQNDIVRAYNTIEARIKQKRNINDNLEATASAIFSAMFVPAYSDPLAGGWTMVTLNDLCDVKGGKRLPTDCELLDTPTTHPYIRVRDVAGGRYVCLTNRFQYIDDETHEVIARYIVESDDIIISIVGTIGLFGKIHRSLNGANLTENCVRLTNIRNVSSDYLYYTLLYKKQINEIELLTVGAVQAKLPIYNIQSIQVALPPQMVLGEFQAKMEKLNRQIEENTLEIERLHDLSDVFLANIAR
ncbi:hypothetical protein AGMMS49975_19290 [Clostridia bacterium]|nr:hypothetical protein AGMMS49975_19290 [Clostridia bacterium]